jgi:hypothetical protein
MREARERVQRKKAAKEARDRLWEALYFAADGIGAERAKWQVVYGSWNSPQADPLLKLGGELAAQGQTAWALAEVGCDLTRHLLVAAIKGDRTSLEWQLSEIDPSQHYDDATDRYCLQVTVQHALRRLRDSWDRLAAQSTAIEPSDFTFKSDDFALLRQIHSPPSPEQQRRQAEAIADSILEKLASRADEIVEMIPAVREGDRSLGRSRGMRVADADAKARELTDTTTKRAKFFALSERKQATRIGCSWSTYSKTDFYREAEELGLLSPRSRKKREQKGSPPSAVSFTPKMEATLGDGDKDQIVHELAEAESEGSQGLKWDNLPEDERQKYIIDHLSDVENNPSPLDPRPKRVRHRKQV